MIRVIGLFQLFARNNVTLRHLIDAVSLFEKSTEVFMAKLSQADIRNPMEIRIINDQLMQLERVFIMVSVKRFRQSLNFLQINFSYSNY